MFRALRAAFIAFLFVASALAADVKPYVNEEMASDAVRLAATLKVEAGKIGAEAQGKTPDDLRKLAGAAVAAGKFDVAAKLAAAAVTAAPKDPANWLAYAYCRGQGRRRPGQQPLGSRHARGGSRLRRLPARRPSGRPGRGAVAARRSPCAPQRLARRARRLQGFARPARQYRCPEDLRGDARAIRLPHPRLQGRQRIRPIRAPASISPSRWRARPISPPMSPCRAPRARRSRTRTSRSASRA